LQPEKENKVWFGKNTKNFQHFQNKKERFGLEKIDTRES
jgi:hypothetical protein